MKTVGLFILNKKVRMKRFEQLERQIDKFLVENKVVFKQGDVKCFLAVGLELSGIKSQAFNGALECL